VFVARRKFALVATAAGLALSVAAQAAGSADHQSAKPRHPDRAADRPRMAVLDKPARHFDKSVRIAHRRAQRAAEAARAAAARESSTSTGSTGATGSTGGFASPESVGISTATLDSIAACESGGDPAAVSPDGTYRGKYQFDYGTWASVGGSGDPAAASAAEQDYRAALLYSRGGSSPWPICGS
jgi:soluble lytic murein transglycosylase-like protein